MSSTARVYLLLQSGRHGRGEGGGGRLGGAHNWGGVHGRDQAVTHLRKSICPLLCALCRVAGSPLASLVLLAMAGRLGEGHTGR